MADRSDARLPSPPRPPGIAGSGLFYSLFVQGSFLCQHMLNLGRPNLLRSCNPFGTAGRYCRQVELYRIAV
jgi:hypothetical protein